MWWKRRRTNMNYNQKKNKRKPLKKKYKSRNNQRKYSTIPHRINVRIATRRTKHRRITSKQLTQSSSIPSNSHPSFQATPRIEMRQGEEILLQLLPLRIHLREHPDHPSAHPRRKEEVQLHILPQVLPLQWTAERTSPSAHPGKTVRVQRLP